MTNLPNMNKPEIERLKQVYANRDIIAHFHDWQKNIYHPRHRVGQLLRVHNQQICVEALNNLQLDLSSFSILDVGCGTGHWLRYLVEVGARPDLLTGIDLSLERITYAQEKNPAINWLEYGGGAFPFESQIFDMVMQVVVFSSILEHQVRLQLAQEMKRVLKPEGYVFWIDLRYSTDPTRLAQFTRPSILSYFPDFTLVYEQPVHPYYFRRLPKGLHHLGLFFYTLCKINCESSLVILKQNGTSS